MNKLLRWILVAVLLRVVAGNAWAMPWALAASDSAGAHTVASASSLPPCHGVQVDAAGATSASPDGHLPANGHAAGAHCSLCFSAPIGALRLPLATAHYAQPPAPKAQVPLWQGAPELRPPI